MIRRFGFPGLASAMLLVSVLSVSWGGAPAPEDQEEVTPAVAAMLKQLNTAPETTLKGQMKLPEGMVAKLMAHRATGAKFTSTAQVMSVTKISVVELERILQPFEDAETERAFEGRRKPVPEPAPPTKASGKLQSGQTAGGQETRTPEVGGAPVATGTGPITLVRPGFYGKLPGYEDLDKIDPLKKTEFLETINREFCTCGCKNETVAFCLVNDPACPVVKSRARKIYDDIVNKPAH